PRAGVPLPAARARRVAGASWAADAARARAQALRRGCSMTRRARTGSWRKPVAGSEHGLQMPRTGRVVLDLRAQTADVNSDRARVQSALVSPYPVHQLVAREHLPGVGGKEQEQVELLERERQQLSALARLTSARVDHDVPKR